ncbi:MAG TPA: winged helix-turn-helix domain-containing protein [Pyrinomonadaceae bacterium]|nr:winged helix-turn-helix domain-containing protein [Pyrinomonadaceae bacterium]
MSKLKVRVNRTRPESLTRQITDQITGLISTGALAAGEMLPSERTLADSLGVARNVVRRSYDYLMSGELIQGEGRLGRRVRGASSGKSGAAGSSKRGKSASGKKSSAGGRKGSKKGSSGKGSRKSGGKAARGRASKSR